MSYILDALRKADAQRQRDPARGIHAQALRTGEGAASARSSHGTWVWSAVALVLAALASGAWYLSRGGDTISAPTSGRAETVARAPAAGAASLAAPVVGAPVVGNAAPAPFAAPVPAPGPAPASPAPPNRVDAPAPAATPAMPPVRDPRATSLPTLRGGPQPGFGAPGTFNPSVPAVQPAAPPAAPAAATQAPAAPPNASVPAAPAVSAPTASGLPPDAPKLAISGGVYSNSAAQRMLIVNGQVFNEGSEVAPGVVVEAIQARTAVLRFRGARYTVAY
jgi:general secretion pathway protein B